MKKAFMIWTTTAAALGYAAGFSTDGFTARAAVQKTESERFIIDPVPANAQNTVESWLGSQLESYIDNKYGSGTMADNWPGDDNQICFQWYRGQREPEGAFERLLRLIAKRFDIAGQFTPGSPD